MRRSNRLLTSTLLATAVVVGTAAASPAGDEPEPGTDDSAAVEAFLRVNQVGYPTGSAKTAYLLSTADLRGETFRVEDARGTTVLTGTVGRSGEPWNERYDFVAALDLSELDAAGTYRVTTSSPDAASPAFSVGSAESLYAGLLVNARSFFQAQRDGADVIPGALDREPAHLNDEHATVYAPPRYRDFSLRGDLEEVGGPVDVSGGWFDAGDYVKFVETTSYADAALLAAVRDAPDVLGAGGAADLTDEVQFGTDWLLRMWDPEADSLRYQVGIGDGNGCGSICGDHDIWRLPERDDTYGGDAAKFRYIRDRPALRATAAGDPISPNLAGRLAATFGLCSQVFRASDPAYADRCLAAGQYAFDRAGTTWRGQLLTVSPHGYYPETSWRDDLELGAAELGLALLDDGAESVADVDLRDPDAYVADAARWAKSYLRKEPYDTLNVYDVSALAHADLHAAIEGTGDPAGLAVTKAQLRGDLRRQVEAGIEQAGRDPFAVAYPYGYDVASHLFGLVATAGAYDRLEGTDRYADFATGQLGAVLGANAWGTSLVVGAGTTFPTCLQHQVANLKGSRDGSPPILAGAVVNGPNKPSQFGDLGLPDGARRCPPDGGDPYARFTGQGGRYLDDVRSWVTVEPAIDFTATSVLALAGVLAAG